MTIEKKRMAAWAAMLVLTGMALLAGLCKINTDTSVWLADGGELHIAEEELKGGPFIIGGEWECARGFYEPSEFDAAEIAVSEDIRYLENMHGYTYRVTLSSDCMERIFLTASRSDLIVWVDGVAVGEDGGRLQFDQAYSLSEYAHGDRAQIVVQVNRLTVSGAYGLLIAGLREDVVGLQSARHRIEAIVIGIYAALLFSSLVLYFGKKSERYLLLLAVFICRSMIGWGEVTLALRFDDMLLADMLFIATDILPYLICCQFVRESPAKALDRVVYAIAAISMVCYVLLGVPYRTIQSITSIIYWMAGIYLALLGKGRGERGTGVLLTGLMTLLVLMAFRLLRDAGMTPHGMLDVGLQLTQHRSLGFMLACAAAAYLRFGGQFWKAEQLAAQFDAKVREQTQELRESNENIIRMQRQNRELMAGMVHNIRSPLFLLGGYFDLLADEIEQPTDEQRKCINLIENKIEHLNRMVQDMFLLVQLEDGQIHFELIRVDARQFLETIVRDARRKGEEKQVSISVECAEGIEFSADQFRLHQAVENIVDNAIRHSHPQGMVRLSACRLDDGSVRLSVADEGSGIPREQMPRLFERYVSKGDGGSTGLGLSIAKYIVDGHHGRIDVQSELGKGTRVDIVIPNL